MTTQTSNPPSQPEGNPAHLEFLLQGPQAWNTWRRSPQGKDPDLRGFDISGEFRRRSEISQDDDVYLPELLMHRAKLAGATLHRCVLDRSDFRSADLTGADLTKSSLLGVDFAGAKLYGTYFGLTRCHHSRFPYGILQHAKLFGNPGDESVHTYPPGIGQVESLAGLMGQIHAIEETFQRNSQSDPLLLYYRGHAKTEWKLTPWVLRERAKDESPNFESQIMNEFVANNPEVFESRESLLSQFVKAQERGLPTRLLDVTSDPLVAMFFAIEDSRYQDDDGAFHVFGVPRSMIKSFDSDTIALICAYARLRRRDQRMLTGTYLGLPNADTTLKVDAWIDAYLARQEIRWDECMARLVGEVGRERGQFEQRVDPFDFFKIFLVTPRAEVRRMREQSGAFIVSAFHERFDRMSVLDTNSFSENYHHLMLTVSAKAKAEIRDELRRLNVTKERVLPSPEVSAEAIRKKYGFE